MCVGDRPLLTRHLALYVLEGMPVTPLWSIEVPSAHGLLRAFEPTQAEVLAAARALAGFNNDRHNAAMLTNTLELTASDIVELYQELRDGGGHPFLLECDGILMGDAAFRGVKSAHAEFAIMVGARREQSRGLGTCYTVMVHQAARLALGIRQVFCTIIPANLASRRMVENLATDWIRVPTDSH